jgi:hypothetical protein
MKLSDAVSLMILDDLSDEDVFSRMQFLGTKSAADLISTIDHMEPDEAKYAVLFGAYAIYLETLLRR